MRSTAGRTIWNSPKPGWSLYDAIVPAALASEAQLESNITAAERATMMAILAKLTAAAEDYA